MNFLKYIALLSCLVLMSSCSSFNTGKFNSSLNIADVFVIGQTTKEEVFTKFGEPTTHRIVGDTETAIYNASSSFYFFLFAAYSGQELVVRFKNDVVQEAKIEPTSSGVGFVYPVPRSGVRVRSQ